MHTDVIQTLSLASAGITVVSAGAALIILRLVFSSTMSREIERELRRRN
jgi:hypothetical protein